MVIVTARRVVAEVVERLGEVNVELAWIGGRRRGDPLANLNGAACPLFVRLVRAWYPVKLEETLQTGREHQRRKLLPVRAKVT